MIIVMSPEATEKDVEHIVSFLQSSGLKAHLSRGEERVIIGAIGDVRKLTPESIEVMPGVEKVVRILHPFKLASRDMKPSNTVVMVGEVPIGATETVIIAGPCSVENYEMLKETALAVKSAGAAILRGGAYKPRTSPYSFQGLGKEGLEMLLQVRKEIGIPVVTEVLSPEQVDLVAQYVDMLQIGARNMQNFALLQEVGASNMPVLLKRGMMSSIEEWLQAAEYILSKGNMNVVLCERGIRTFETYTRNTLDLSAVPVVKKLSHLPVIVDPSHGTGKWELVTPMAKAAIACGADGLMIEVHPKPEEALSDGPQCLRPGRFLDLVNEIVPIAHAVNRPLWNGKVCGAGE